VLVEGPTLGAQGRWLKLGEELRVALDDRPSAPPSVSSNVPVAAPPQPGSTAVTLEPSASARRQELVPWQDLARHERYAAALAAAETNGFDATCRAATAKDLLLLGNAARFAGSAERAEQAFRLVRSRFAGSHEASMAAFFLGRIAYDQRGSRKEAADWFQSYLREEPTGGLAREAAGRLLEAQRALGDRAAARVAAKSYLEKYPSGPHAGLARELLQP
jgi:transmembrane sensor